MKKPIIGLVPLFDDEKESLWMLPGYMDGITEAYTGFRTLQTSSGICHKRKQLSSSGSKRCC